MSNEAQILYKMALVRRALSLLDTLVSSTDITLEERVAIKNLIKELEDGYFDELEKSLG